MPPLSERLREERLAAGLSQRDLAAALGKDREWISRIEVGTTRLPGDDVPRVASVLGLTVAEFYGEVPVARRMARAS